MPRATGGESGSSLTFKGIGVERKIRVGKNHLPFCRTKKMLVPREEWGRRRNRVSFKICF